MEFEIFLHNLGIAPMLIFSFRLNTLMIYLLSYRPNTINFVLYLGFRYDYNTLFLFCQDPPTTPFPLISYCSYLLFKFKTYSHYIIFKKYFIIYAPILQFISKNIELLSFLYIYIATPLWIIIYCEHLFVNW